VHASTITKAWTHAHTSKLIQALAQSGERLDDLGRDSLTHLQIRGDLFRHGTKLLLIGGQLMTIQLIHLVRFARNSEQKFTVGIDFGFTLSVPRRGGLIGLQLLDDVLQKLVVHIR